MALVTCPDCQQQISDAAVSCPHCGRPLKAEVPQSQLSKPIASNDFGCLILAVLAAGGVGFVMMMMDAASKGH